MLVWKRLVAVHFVVDFLQFSKTCKCRKVCVCLAQCFLCNERNTFGAWSYCCGDKKKYEGTLYALSELNAPHFLVYTFWFLSPCTYHATCSGIFVTGRKRMCFPEQINAKAIKSEFEDPAYRTLWIWICTSDVCFTWVLLLRKSRVVLRGTLEWERERECGTMIGLQSVWDYENRQRCSPWPLMANKTTLLKPTYIKVNDLFHA